MFAVDCGCMNMAFRCLAGLRMDFRRVRKFGVGSDGKFSSQPLDGQKRIVE